MLETLNRLHVAYAQKELARLKHLRAIVDANEAGTPQTTIALNAGISQAEVSRTLRRIAAVPEMLSPSPREIVLQQVTGAINHAEMMEKLAKWNHSFARDAEPNNPLSVRTSGTWEQIEDALHMGLITDDDYDHLVESVRPSCLA